MHAYWIFQRSVSDVSGHELFFKLNRNVRSSQGCGSKNNIDSNSSPDRKVISIRICNNNFETNFL